MLRHKKYSEQELIAFIQSAFTYKDGALYRKSGAGGEVIGSKAGRINPRKEGDIYISIKDKMYGLHRIIFAFHNGYVPEEVDHIDRNPLNNRIENLRACTASLNSGNKGLMKTNTSGFKGVCWDKRKGKWVAQITGKDVRKFLGYFDDPQDAANEYDKAALKVFGEFALTNAQLKQATTS